MQFARTAAIILLIGGTAFASPAKKGAKHAKTPKPSVLAGKTIVIDAGHGVVDFSGRIINSGRQSRDGRPEYDLNFRIAQHLGQTLTDQGARVVYTRTRDDYWRVAYNQAEDNKARAFLANELKADALVAVHCDWDPRSRTHGVTTLYEKPNARHLGECIQRHLVRELRAHDRKVVHDSFTILDNADVPAVIVESGFMSNRSEARKLATSAYQLKVAKAIANGLRVYFAD